MTLMDSGPLTGSSSAGKGQRVKSVLLVDPVSFLMTMRFPLLISDVLWVMATWVQADCDLVTIPESLGAIRDPAASEQGITAM
ncbi:hypothetical protein NKDENANG_03482 [Candidatus Entotheonellaceae bacterium PAL068K]